MSYFNIMIHLNFNSVFSLTKNKYGIWKLLKIFIFIKYVYSNYLFMYKIFKIYEVSIE